MSETKRKTRICSIDDLAPSLSGPIRAHIKQYQLAGIEANVLSCCETASIQQKKGFFGGSESAVSAALVTPLWLIWAESANNKTAEVNSAMLSHIDVHDYGGSAMGTISPDTGINITGRYTNVGKTGQAFIGIGPEADGIKFREALHTAINMALIK